MPILLFIPSVVFFKLFYCLHLIFFLDFFFTIPYSYFILLLFFLFFLSIFVNFILNYWSSYSNTSEDIYCFICYFFWGSCSLWMSSYFGLWAHIPHRILTTPSNSEFGRKTEDQTLVCVSPMSTKRRKGMSPGDEHQNHG